jgi:hypothetical protein
MKQVLFTVFCRLKRELQNKKDRSRKAKNIFSYNLRSLYLHASQAYLGQIL